MATANAIRTSSPIATAAAWGISAILAMTRSARSMAAETSSMATGRAVPQAGQASTHRRLRLPRSLQPDPQAPLWERA